MQRATVLFGVLLFVAGCAPSNQPTFQPTYPVRGKLLDANGAPVRGGRIELRPADPALPEARGFVKTDGTFELGTYKLNDGVAAGRYTVTVDPIVFDKAGNPRRQSLPIPKKYGDPSTSDLKVEIEARTNEVVWSLK